RPPVFQPPRPMIPQPPVFPQPMTPRPPIMPPIIMPPIHNPHVPIGGPQWVWKCNRCNQVVATGFARPNLASCPHCGAGGNAPGGGNPFLGNDPVQQPVANFDAPGEFGDGDVRSSAPDAGVRWGLFVGMTLGVSVLTGVTVTMLKRLGD